MREIAYQLFLCSSFLYARKFLNTGIINIAVVLVVYVDLIKGTHGSRLGGEDAVPPLPQRCDWEIDPNELDFSSSVIIGKVWTRWPFI